MIKCKIHIKRGRVKMSKNGCRMEIRICPICKKSFIPSGQHQFKVDGVLVCSYNCREKGKHKRIYNSLKR